MFITSKMNNFSSNYALVLCSLGTMLSEIWQETHVWCVYTLSLYNTVKHLRLWYHRIMKLRNFTLLQWWSCERRTLITWYQTQITPMISFVAGSAADIDFPNYYCQLYHHYLFYQQNPATCFLFLFLSAVLY